MAHREQIQRHRDLDAVSPRFESQRWLNELSPAAARQVRSWPFDIVIHTVSVKLHRN